MRSESHEMGFRIYLDLEEGQTLDPLVYPTLCKRMRFVMSRRRSFKYWEYLHTMKQVEVFCSFVGIPIGQIQDMHKELCDASRNYDMYIQINYYVMGRACEHRLKIEDIDYILRLSGCLYLRYDFICTFFSEKLGRQVRYLTNSSLTDDKRYKSSCHAFLLPAGTGHESIVKSILKKVSNGDTIYWKHQDILGSSLASVVDVESAEVDTWLETLPMNALSSVPTGLCDMNKESVACLLLLFQSNDDGYPCVIPKGLLEFLNAYNLELRIIQALETTYDGIQV